nr:hypothetical protein [Tanacetum cinerariifolium]
MSSSTHPIILYDFDVEDTFSSTQDLSEDQLVTIAVSPFHDDPYTTVIQAYYATNELHIPPPAAPIAPPPSLIASSDWPFVSTVPGQGKVSNIPTVHSWGGSIGPDGFLPSILLLVVIVVAVVIVVVAVILVVVVSFIVKLSFLITGFETVTFPLILRGNPSMKTSIIFLEFGTIMGHKTANSWNLFT